jgi:DNA invertase Pin-like site-specific DNA recombinase
MSYKEQSKDIAAIYDRLSDDDEQDGTSISIETQRKINSDYCKTNGILIYDFYDDDGYSGTNFNRPSFQRMMEDARAKKFNIIVVKDLSRFGRNYIQMGSYLSEILPAMGIRFIAIHDSVDSIKTNVDYDLTIPIKNVFNEYYPADCSRKTRMAFITKASHGEFIGSQAPYGYRKSEADKHVLEIDEVTAPTVVWMFQAAAYLGYGYEKIARALKERRVITPAAYQAKRANRPYEKDPYEWNFVTVYRMFENQTYLGHLVSGKRRKASFKSKRIVKKPEEEWIVVKDIFPALIDQRLWDDAHAALKHRKRETKSGFDNIFAGLLKCDKCGYSLGIASANHRDAYYMCNKYKKKGPSYCSSHYILYYELYDSILTDLRETLQTIQTDRKIFVDTVLRKVEESCGCERKGIEQEMQSLHDRISSLDKRYEQLYEDRLSGLISNQKFKELSGKCETEQGSLSERLEILQQKIKSQGIGVSEIEDFVRLVEKYETPTKLDRELLNRLIDSIEIGDRIKEPEGTKQSITINYKFVGKIA